MSAHREPSIWTESYGGGAPAPIDDPEFEEVALRLAEAGHLRDLAGSWARAKADEERPVVDAMFERVSEVLGREVFAGRQAMWVIEGGARRSEAEWFSAALVDYDDYDRSQKG